MSGRALRIYISMAMLLIVCMVVGNNSFAQSSDSQTSNSKGVNVGPGEMGIDAIIVEGPPITADKRHKFYRAKIVLLVAVRACAGEAD